MKTPVIDAWQPILKLVELDTSEINELSDNFVFRALHKTEQDDGTKRKPLLTLHVLHRAPLHLSTNPAEVGSVVANRAAELHAAINSWDETKECLMLSKSSAALDQVLAIGSAGS